MPKGELGAEGAGESEFLFDVISYRSFNVKFSSFYSTPGTLGFNLAERTEVNQLRVLSEDCALLGDAVND